MPMRHQRALVATAAALTFLAGCGSDADETGNRGFNDADVDFAGDMIQHHAQALQMVDLTMGRDLSPEVAALAEDIRAAQAPEVEVMVDWLQEWDQPVPETGRDHANAHADDHGDGGPMDADMPGMLGAEQLTALEEAPDDEFEPLFLSLMIEHHQGAVQMAEDVVEDGRSEETRDLAEEIIRVQEEEISTMRELLDD